MSFLPAKDNASSYVVKKEQTFDLPFKLLLVGKSLIAGKSTAILNLLLRPYDDTDEQGKNFYKNNFEGKNIYIINPSLHLDDKYAALIKAKRIPEGNIYTEYDEDEMMALYDRIREQYDEEVKVGKIEPKLIIADDLAHNGDLKAKQYGFFSRVAANGRHLGISLIVTSQKYTAINVMLRENATGLILWECSTRQLESICDDHCVTSKKEFEKMFRECTREKHSFFVINYSKSIEDRFMNSKFESITAR